ncbi:hypothetical protein HMPREF0454_01644 [Hafnia alvei ATCC 51873]|uniref:Uncharacterized protein n=1 Tax=Hafnia alvei ATCC 51873 TaxID=1002364 RepID=G9Y506_HAFAL|nr:hypothetical protein HMPREF0454_01644 [Hafnia alvei ATCC 51873]
MSTHRKDGWPSGVIRIKPSWISLGRTEPTLRAGDSERWEYKYNPFRRRISKHCINQDKPSMDFHLNDDQLTEEISVRTDGSAGDGNALFWIIQETY